MISNTMPCGRLRATSEGGSMDARWMAAQDGFGRWVYCLSPYTHPDVAKNAGLAIYGDVVPGQRVQLEGIYGPSLEAVAVHFAEMARVAIAASKVQLPAEFGGYVLEFRGGRWLETGGGYVVENRGGRWLETGGGYVVENRGGRWLETGGWDLASGGSTTDLPD